MPETTSSPAAPVRYVRLPGRGRSRKGAAVISAVRVTCRLWLGDDHLLQVESTGGYAENYKRFYFRDIQAIYLRQTNAWLVGNVVLGILAAGFALGLLAVRDPGGVITLGIISGAFAVFLAANLLLGPTCACHLQTAVHREELPSLRRQRNARRWLARVKPLIESAQGCLAPEALAAEYAARLARARATAAAPGQGSIWADAALTPYRSRAHRALFCIFLADAGTNALNIFLPGVVAILLALVVGGALAFAVIAALIKQRKTDLRPALRRLTWVAAAVVGLGYLINYGVMMALVSGKPLDGTQWGYLRELAALNPLETPWWLGILAGSLASSLILGVVGLLLLRQRPPEKTPTP